MSAPLSSRSLSSRALSRRSLLRGRVAGPPRVVPPGFLGDRPEACASCSLCLDHCPTGIIVLADGGPVLDFSRGECTFCGECAAHCPEAETLFSQAPPAFSHVVEVTAACLPVNGVDCQACRDPCPENAIRFRPRRGGPFLPEVDEAACSGCGACVAVCPVEAVAVRFKKEPVHA